MGKPFHELTDEEYRELQAEGTTFQELADKHPPPSWCTYPEPLVGRLGCWSLVFREVTGRAFCKVCEYYQESEGNTENVPDRKGGVC